MHVTYLRVDLKPTSPFRIGSLTGARNALAVETDIDGRPVVPASGLAGSFRAHIGAAAAALHMGRVEAGADGAEFFASNLWFLGTALDGLAEKRSRTATAIDRRHRAARKTSSHTVEEVYDASLIKLYLRYEGRADDILGLLASWPVLIGGGVSSGLGQARVTGIRHRTLDMTDPADVLARASLSGAGPGAMDSLLDGAANYLEGMHEGDASAGGLPIEIDAACHIDGLSTPVAKRDDESRPEHYWFRGTSWKGLLRSRVEYIGRSLGLNVCGVDGKTWDGCGRCTVCDVFGSSATGVARWSFSFTKLSDAAAQRDRTRVSIERFTGGAADARLFPERTLSDDNAKFTVRRLAAEDLEPRHAWVAKALLLALLDLHEGYTGIGGRSATGLGTVTFNTITLGADFADQQFSSVAETGLPAVPRITPEDLEAARRDKETNNG